MRSTPPIELDPLERVVCPSLAGNQHKTAKSNIISLVLSLSAAQLRKRPFEASPGPDNLVVALEEQAGPRQLQCERDQP